MEVGERWRCKAADTALTWDSPLFYGHIITIPWKRDHVHFEPPFSLSAASLQLGKKRTSLHLEEFNNFFMF
jgi:hypothetical protein